MEFLQNIKKNYDEWTRITPQGLLYDRTLFWLFVILLLIGLIAVTSASIPYSSRLFNDPFYFAKRDAIYVLLSLLTCYISLHISSSQWEKWHAKIFLFSVILLLLVPFIGTSVNGAKRWISLGILNFQPAEFAKLALTCFLASYFTRRYDEVRSRHVSIFKPLIVMLVLGCFLLLQPDLGSTVVLFIIMSGMLFIVGAKILQFVGLIALGGILFVWLVLTASYRLKRFTGFLEPFKDPYGTGFQLTNSLIAFGRGEITGEGLGNSIQKLDYLPEAHTDFIMAIIGEEFGFIGIFIVILLLGLLIFRAMKIGRESLMLEQRFRGFFALGIGFWIFFQGFVNLGMALGMLPTKGLTFPLVSYGGSSIIIMSATIGILLRIDHENRLFRIGQARLRDD
ncbi:TPA: putative lipid II flippase FtsW [Haemophilus influenzae]|uniref:putative lipid II flippase FtsW n=1 Tax=Haemophilus influenzae TaxID=727 RepID=UPI000E582908|nr:putative lipid II flippase FtsW [Haemophilus influenzae]MCK9061222.1 putative lipid II flippase FtsW [Haemophilus influenzae]MCK9079181.1 putative lipid II flippase FtsW [Haemophilus influenzae]MCK9118009.1 putative lipid II flippase FtsW [Haemophilus influenzae]